MIPFFIFYSMFGFQRIGDLIWAAGDMRGRGFLLGATAGRTTLNGEGLQHQDGHSHLLACRRPNAARLRSGLRLRAGRDHRRTACGACTTSARTIFYYLTLYNENYRMPPMPEGATEGILKGLYRSVRARPPEATGRSVQLFGSGSMLARRCGPRSCSASSFGVAADVWSVTSYKELRRDALECERWNRLHPAEPSPDRPT